MYHCYVLSSFCRSSSAVQYGVQKIIYERTQIIYNFANGLLNRTKFSEVCSFSLQLAHDESFHFPNRSFLLFPVPCKLFLEAFLERLSLKTSPFRKHSMLQYFVHDLTQVNLKQGLRR